MTAKRTLCMLLCLSMVFGLLAGCGKSEPVSQEPSAMAAAQTEPVPETVSETVPETTAPPEVSRFSYMEQMELDKAAELGFPCDKLEQETISGEELAALLDHFIGLVAPGKQKQWESMYPNLRASQDPLIRFDAMASLFLAALQAGKEYSQMQNDARDFFNSLNHSWDEDYLKWDLYGGWNAVSALDNGTGPQPLDGASYFYTLGRTSPFSGEYLFSLDEATNSLRVRDHCTYAEALMAIVRLMCSADASVMGSMPVDVAASDILTPALLKRSQANPAVSAEDHPVWNGFVLSWDAHAGYFATVDAIEHIADWGFNSVRIMIDYRELFDPENVTVGNTTALLMLDEFVAAAIRRDLHLNLCFSYLPGRWFSTDNTTYTSVGEFDLFINPAKQEQANAIWQAMAARYQDVSSFNLSFTPFWEAMNMSLSTGLPAPDYTPENVASYLSSVVDVIRAQTPDRLIIYEPTPTNRADDIIREATPSLYVAEEKGNMIISYNFCDIPFVYAHMTAEEGQHIDNNNHSMYTPAYPAYYYSLAEWVGTEAPLTIDGCLPAGTVIELYLASSEKGTLEIQADGQTIYTENLPGRHYNQGNPLSRYYRYASSDKKVTVTLEQDVQTLSIGTASGSFVWCGMDVFLPEQYAQDRWYYATDYDVFLGHEEEMGIVKKHDARILVWPVSGSGCRNATIHEDLTYTTPEIWEESSAETIQAWCDTIADFNGNCVIRFERAAFTGVEWTEMKEYYTDMHEAFEENGFSWWTNDYWIMTYEWPQTRVVADSPVTSNADFPYFNQELLELLQSYQ